MALGGDIDRAFDYLRDAVERGWTTPGPPEKLVPEFSILADDPRFEEISAMVLETINRDRAIVGLPPVNENYQPVL